MSILIIERNQRKTPKSRPREKIIPKVIKFNINSLKIIALIIGCEIKLFYYSKYGIYIGQQ